MLGLQEIYEDEELFYIVLDYQESGTLHNHISNQGKFSEATTRIIMEQLLLAVDYLHFRQVIHRDIKLENILINRIEEGNYKVKIADFGIVVLAPTQGCLKEKCGSPNYLAPEMLRNQGYDSKCDIFSLGSVFFNLLTGHYLFTGSNLDQVLKQNESCDLTQIGLYVGHTSPQC